jgi:hypothetical protein
MTYNPFERSLALDDLTANDLVTLISNEITEGQWIEYKREFPLSQKIAKSISSFANTYGGWYFIGIEADKTKNVATNICGFNLADISDPIAKLRDSIKANVDPVPVFHTKLIEIGAGKAVLVVQIPDHQATPFITKEGRIYRRISDSSDPIPENDRHAIDRLVDNGQELETQFIQFCKDERMFSKAEENQSWVSVFLSPYPLGMIGREDMLSSDAIEKLIRLSQSPIKINLDATRELGTGNLPFNMGQVGIGSVILRQVEPAKVAFNSLSVEFFMDGRAKFFIPLHYLPSLYDINIDGLKSQQVKQTLKSINESAKVTDSSLIRFFDIQDLWVSVAILLNFYQVWYGAEVEQNSLRVSIMLNDIWRASPFCDSDEWALHVQKFGLPIQNVDSIKFPNEKRKWIIDKFPIWNNVCSFIGMGFGLPIDLFSNIIFPNVEAQDQ